MIKHSRVLAAIGCAAFMLAGSTEAAGTARKRPEWSDTGLFSFVLTSGNSDSKTGGLTNTLGCRFGQSTFELSTRGYRVESTPRYKIAVGSGPGDFQVMEFKSQLAAESYRVGTRFDGPIDGKLVWVLGGGWERNPFLGLHTRIQGFAGIGHHWIRTDQTEFRTDYTVTRTREQDIVDDPEVMNDFTGARFSSRLTHTFTTGASVGHELIIDQNLDRTKDLRGDMTTWLTFASGPHLAVQTAVELVYDRDPALQEIPLFNLLGLPTGQNVLIPLKDLDTTFTTSLVVHF